MNLSEEHKEYMTAIEALNEKGKAIRDDVAEYDSKRWKDYLEEIRKEQLRVPGEYTASELTAILSDNVNNPKHYEVLPGVEVYDIREAILSKYPHLHPCVADDWSRASEYLLRMFGKNGLEDAKKARWYLNKLIERMEENG
jgi:hypothetical protein